VLAQPVDVVLNVGAADLGQRHARERVGLEVAADRLLVAPARARLVGLAGAVEDGSVGHAGGERVGGLQHRRAGLRANGAVADRHAHVVARGDRLGLRAQRLSAELARPRIPQLHAVARGALQRPSRWPHLRVWTTSTPSRELRLRCIRNQPPGVMGRDVGASPARSLGARRYSRRHGDCKRPRLMGHVASPSRRSAFSSAQRSRSPTGYSRMLPRRMQRTSAMT
jgi:hypothetical protein